MSAQFDMLTQHNHPSSQGEEEGKVNHEDAAPSANANVPNPSSPGVASRPSHHSKDDSSIDSDPIRSTSDVSKRRKAKANVDVFPDDIPDGDKKPAAKPERRRRSQRRSLATQLPIPNCESASFNVP